MDTAARRFEQVLLRRYCEDGDFRARDEVIERAMPLVHTVARRYANRGIEHDELVQVGAVGLVKAVDRFDATRDLAFSSFAVPNIAGEIRRYFRDQSRPMRAPRDIQEAAELLRRHTDRLVTALRRTPTVTELAEATGLEVDAILDVQAAMHETNLASLDATVRDDDESATRGDLVSSIEHGFVEAEDRTLADDALRSLRPREQEIVRLRYEEDLTQSEIAERIGISQMHVSRLLRQALTEMREHLEAPAGRVA